MEWNLESIIENSVHCLVITCHDIKKVILYSKHLERLNTSSQTVAENMIRWAIDAIQKSD